MKAKVFPVIQEKAATLNVMWIVMDQLQLECLVYNF